MNNLPKVVICSFAPSRIITHDLLIIRPTLYPLHHRTIYVPSPLVAFDFVVNKHSLCNVKVCLTKLITTYLNTAPMYSM